jgi:hypothetical protein
MASEQEQGIDRRRALGMIGKASAATAAIGVSAGALAAGSRGRTGRLVELATVRSEFDGGAAAVPLDEILPDGIVGPDVIQAGKLMEHRIGGVIEILSESGRADHAMLVEAKHAMNRARAQVKSIIASVNDGSLQPAAARAKARTMFDVYFSEMKALGV